MHRHQSERGNVIFVILLAIVLFAALSYAVSNGMRGGPTSLSSAKQEALASDIIVTASGYEKAVNKLISKSNSESRLSFVRSASDGYELTPASTAAERVFSPTGGGANYVEPALDALDTTQSEKANYADWQFTGANTVPDLESSDAELVAILPYIRADVCARINKRLGVTNPSDAPPVEADQMNLLTKFTGTFTTVHAINTTGDHTRGKKAACVEGTQDSTGAAITGQYYFYYVLYAR